MKMNKWQLVSLGLGLVLCVTWLAGFRGAEGEKELMTISVNHVNFPKARGAYVYVNGQEVRFVHQDVGDDRLEGIAKATNGVLNEYYQQGWRLVTAMMEEGPLYHYHYYLEK